MKVKERNKIIIQMVIAIIGVVGGLLGVNAFYQYVLMSRKNKKTQQHNKQIQTKQFC